MKKIVLALVFGFCSAAFADPAPFGLELNKATFKEVVKKYPEYEITGTSFLNGKVIQIKASEFELEGIEDRVEMAFDDKDILHSVNFRAYMVYIRNSLERKYKRIAFNKERCEAVSEINPTPNKKQNNSKESVIQGVPGAVDNIGGTNVVCIKQSLPGYITFEDGDSWIGLTEANLIEIVWYVSKKFYATREEEIKKQEQAKEQKKDSLL